MKWNVPASVAIGFAMVLGTASGIQLFGQQGPNSNGPDRPNQNNPGPQLNGQLPPGGPGRNNPGPDGFPGYHPVQQGGPIAPAYGPYSHEQRMVPYSYTTRTADGRTVTSSVMRPEEEVNRLNASHQVLRDAQAKLRTPDATDSDKKEARESIAKYLKEEFERDQKARREQVEKLEEQVAKLRKQLDKRQESQGKIIELRMQLLENEAEGLAFPEAFNDLNGPGNWQHSYSPYAPPLISPYPVYAPSQPSQFQPYPMPVTPLGPVYSQPGMNGPQPKLNPPKDNQSGKAAKTNEPLLGR